MRISMATGALATALMCCVAQAQSTISPFASKDDLCWAYAQNMLQWSKANEDNKCGMTGPRWSTNTGEIQNWCVSNLTDGQAYHGPAGGWLGDPNAQTDLNPCLGCLQIAHDVIEAFRKDRLYGCGLGSRLSASYSISHTDQEENFQHCKDYPSSYTYVMLRFINDVNNKCKPVPPWAKGKPTLPGFQGATSARQHKSTAAALKNVGVVDNPCKPGVRAASGPCADVTAHKVIGPGLLESDDGFARQGPGATGTPNAARVLSTPSAPAAAPVFRSR